MNWTQINHQDYSINHAFNYCLLSDRILFAYQAEVLQAWLEKNCVHKFVLLDQTSRRIACFSNKDDAVCFKLRWENNSPTEDDWQELEAERLNKIY
jgi:hypothetical protein